MGGGNILHNRTDNSAYQILCPDEIVDHEQVDPPVDPTVACISYVAWKERTIGKVSVETRVEHDCQHQGRHQPKETIYTG